MKKFLSDVSAMADFSLTENQLSQLEQYKNLLIEWNKKMNLTAITEEKEVATKHFLDSFYGLKFIKGAKTLIDVGTGAGFPGLPLKIIAPDITLTLLDSLNKRITFLTEVKNQLGLENVTCVHSRAEDGGVLSSPFRESFDIATSRAVADLAVLSEYCLPYVKVGGMFLAYKGKDVDEELLNAENAITTLGGEVIGVFPYTIPTTDITHSIIAIKKVKHTPEKFPRLQGKIAKKPL